ncbi:MAG: MarR family transcriptional regulator [Oscillospiraceae bacterium]|nr:MarR family transcriptional regulator [Oscillospiraceae bacterium]
MAEFDNLKLDNQLCFPLYATARSVVNLYTPFLKPLGLTYTQYLVFLVLWEQDGISVGELCSKLYLDSGTITPLLKKMEEKGYIERRRSHEDERVVSVFLTEKGHDLKNEAKNIPTNVGQCIHLEPDEAVCLYSLLYKILGQKNQ